MSRAKWMVVLAVFVVLAAVVVDYAAAQPKREGSEWKELAARKPPSPERIAVTVMPFAAPEIPLAAAATSPTEFERQIELPRACVLLNLQRHGFGIVPQADNLTAVPGLTNKAMGLKAENKFRAQRGREEAVEAGRKLGADWVIYGEYTLQQDFRVKTGLFVRLKKQIRVSLHLRLADVKSGEVLYWSRLEDEAQGSSTVTGFGAMDEDRKIARGILVDLVGAAVDDIAQALPKHKIGPKVTREQLDKLIGAMGF